MFKVRFTISVLLMLMCFNVQVINADSADKKKISGGSTTTGGTTKKTYSPTFDTTAGDYHNGKNYDPCMVRGVTDWSKPVPVERDIKCPRCSGTGITKEMVGNVDPVLEIKICKRCSGKGTIGRTKI